MGKKSRKQKVVLTLGEFNQDAAKGPDPQDAAGALPSAPRAAEDWDEAGGKPVYNARGYRETGQRAAGRPRRDADGDDQEYMEPDWTRSGPLDGPDSNTQGRGAAGMGGGERSWDAVRTRGPLDADADAATHPQEADVDWSNARRGPLDAHPASQNTDLDRSWSDVRRGGPLNGDADAAFATSATATERDWDDIRRQPLDGDLQAERELDFSDARRGPIDQEKTLHHLPQEVDFTLRRGPIDTELDTSFRDVDFAVRQGPIDTNESSKPLADIEIDFANMRSIDRTINPSMEKSSPNPLVPNEPDFSAIRRRAETPHGPEVSREPDFGALRKSESSQKFLPSNAVDERDFERVRGSAAVVERDHLFNTTRVADSDFAEVRRIVMTEESAAPHVGASVDGEANRREKESPPLSSVGLHRGHHGQVSTTKNLVTTEAFVAEDDSVKVMSIPVSEQAGTPSVPSSEASSSDHTPKELEHSRSRPQVSTRKNERFFSDATSPKEMDWGRARQIQPLPPKTQGGRVLDEKRGQSWETRRGLKSDRPNQHPRRADGLEDTPNPFPADVTSAAAETTEDVGSSNISGSPADNEGGDWTTVQSSTNSNRRTSTRDNQHRGGGAYRRGGGFRGRERARLVPGRENDHMSGNGGRPRANTETTTMARPSRNAGMHAAMSTTVNGTSE